MARPLPSLLHLHLPHPRFQPWPESSLFSVAKKFLDEIDLGEDFLRNAVVEFMPYSFALVNKVSKSEWRRVCFLSLQGLWPGTALPDCVRLSPTAVVHLDHQQLTCSLALTACRVPGG